MRKIIPVILAGGSGTRLWPLSRKTSPKQFIKLIGNHSLFQQTLLRVKELSSVDEVIIMINQDHYFLCQDQVNELKMKNVKMILEPCSRNTAPAIALAAHVVSRSHKDDPYLLILPADHLIGELPTFKDFINNIAKTLPKNRLLTFGVIPTSPKTGYGYIESGAKLDEHTFRIEKFTEKPDKETAESFLAAKNYYWNSGMFFFSAKTYLNELKSSSPDIYEASMKAYHASEEKGDFLRIDPNSFSKCPNDSIDYAVMEKTKNGAVIPFNLPWSDLGCWATVADAGESDENENVIQGNVILQKAHGCFLTSSGKQLLAAIGIKNLIVVSTPDAILVAEKSYAQDVKEIVNALQKTDASLTTHHKKTQTPWGCFENLIETLEFHIRYLEIDSGKKVRLDQSGFITLIQGSVEVITEHRSIFLRKKTSQPIPKKSIVRNNSKETAHLLEINLIKEEMTLPKPSEIIESLLNRAH